MIIRVRTTRGFDALTKRSQLFPSECAFGFQANLSKTKRVGLDGVRHLTLVELTIRVRKAGLGGPVTPQVSDVQASGS